jgi:putative GTP pyrophosphokinase
MKTLKIRDTRIAEPRMSSARESIPEALQRYESLRPTYEGFSRLVRQILTDKLRERAVRIHSIEARAKSAESVERKMLRMFEPKRFSSAVEDPLRWVTDLAAVRVITFFPRTVSEIDAIIRERFFVLEKDNKSEMLQASGRFGYHSVHYLVELPPEEADRPDRERFGGLVAEIQVRTILQHAWAEIEHDIQYKSVRAIPSSTRRRLAALAGLLEIADREFQTIQDEDERNRRHLTV